MNARYIIGGTDSKLTITCGGATDPDHPGEDGLLSYTIWAYYSWGGRVQSLTFLEDRGDGTYSWDVMSPKATSQTGVYFGCRAFDGTDYSWDITSNKPPLGVSVPSTLEIDTDPPLLSSSAQKVSGNSVRYTWVTNEPATSKVICSGGKLFGDRSQGEASFKTAHDVTVNLGAGTWKCTIESVDLVGNVATVAAKDAFGSDVVIAGSSGSVGTTSIGKTTAAKTVGIVKRGFKDDSGLSQYSDYIVWGLFLVVLAFCVLGALKDKEASKRLFKWE
jgi:hypothetical protein